MPDWIEALLALQRSGRGAVLVTVAAVEASAPRSAGTKMVVSAAEVTGTIGGGHLEFTAIDIARRQLEGGAVAQVHRFPLGASLGQCCGGVVNLLFEPVAPDAAWVGTLAGLLAERRPVVGVTPLRGSHAEKLLVTSDSVNGSLGSEARDAEAVAKARELLGGRDGARVIQCSDAGEEEHACFFDPSAPTDFEIVLFGAGHVG
ncbi:MAG: XdhC family protein, partial [Betaproteobacteria bacterium]